MNTLHELVNFISYMYTQGMDSTTTTLIISGAGILISALISFIIASLKIGEYKNKVDRAVTDITEIKTEHREVRDKVIACETSLKEREPLTKRKSPVVLTERGNKVLTDSKGNDFVDTNYAELKKSVEDRNPQNSYDIQEFAKKVIETLKEDPRINPVKDYLFKEGMEFDEVAEVLGIYLRDKLMKEKGINPEDIDKHDPSKTSHVNNTK